MQRTIRIQGVLQEEKYRLKEEYRGVGIYEYITPNGYTVCQHYLICCNDKLYVSESYNHNDKEDLMDYIDNYLDSGKFGFKAINYGDHYVVHPSGNLYL